MDTKTLLLFWSAADASHVHALCTATCTNMTSIVSSNRIIQGYDVEITDGGTGDQTSYTTYDKHLLLGNLKPHNQYTFRVAMYCATNTGPYSQPITVILNSTKGTIL